MPDQADFVYEEASKLSAAVTKGLINSWEKLGCPSDCSVNSGWVMLDTIMEIWTKFYPKEKEDWIKQLKHDLTVERSAAEAKGFGYFPVSYPTRLFRMIKTMLPDQKLNDKDFLHHLIQRYPFLQSSNYKI